MAKKNTRNTKSRIVSAAWKLFYENGYDDTTVEEIVEESGTSKGSFYHYFSGKDALLSSLSDLFDDKYQELIPTLDPEMDSFEQLMYLNREMFLMIDDSISLDLTARLYASQLITTGEKHLLDHNRIYYKLLRQIVTEGQKKGELREDVSVNEIVKAYALCERALIYDWCISNGDYSLCQYAKSMMPVFLNSFRVKKAKNGEWGVYLIPTKTVPHEWFGEMRGKKILGLASGGGQQMPIFAALGAKCTVLDYSEKQLESERMVAQREGYDITIVRADMTKRLPFDDNSFDLIFHPVSNCYVYAVLPIWRECARVLKPGGRLLAGLDNGFNYAFDEDETKIINTLPFNPLEDEDQMRQLQKDDSGIQFSHTAHEQLTGQLKAGLQLLDLYEDTNGYGNLHAHNIPTYWATLARKA